MQYTLEEQTSNRHNYLDISIENKQNNLIFGIYRMLTTTDLIVHKDSCRPTEYKNSAIRYMINRMNTYPISTNNKYYELQHISTISQNNNYPQYTHNRKRNIIKTQHIIINGQLLLI
jgi:hypothetical protein